MTPKKATGSRARQASAKSPSPSRQKKPAKKRLPIHKRQYTLPFGFKPDGRFALLNDVLSSDTPTRQLDDLNEDEMVALTAERIRMQEKFRIAMFGVGILEKEAAIDHVMRRTPAGMALVDIEKRVLRRVIARAKAEAGEGR